MERNKTEIRYRPDEPIRLNVLSGMAHTVSAYLTDLNGRRATVKIEHSLPASSAVRMDLNDSLLLGEVVACTAEGSSFVAQIEVVEAIASMSDLARLVAAVMNEGRSKEIGDHTAARAARAR